MSKTHSTRDLELRELYDQLMFLKIRIGLLSLLIASTSLRAQELKEVATLAAGCFWGTEEFFRKIPGVLQTRVGYTGGALANPRYEQTHGGRSGHAESLEIVFDPKQVSFEKLLDQFFKMHDPTTLNRQGNDVGSQYRSAIFVHSKRQLEVATAFKRKVEKSGAWKAPIVTEISEAKIFWPAEKEHQQYLQKHPGGYDNHFLRKLDFGN